MPLMISLPLSSFIYYKYAIIKTFRKKKKFFFSSFLPFRSIKFSDIFLLSAIVFKIKQV